MLLMGQGSARATAYTWAHSSGNTRWNRTQNWSPNTGSVPGSGDTVTFNGTSTDGCNVNAAVDVASITMTSAYTGAVTNSSSGGSFHVRGAMSLSGGSGSSWQATSGTTRIDGALTIGNNTTFDANSGTLLLAATSNQSHTFGGETFNQVIVNDGLVAYYRLDDGSGTTATDSSGFANNGTLTSSPTWLSSGLPTINYPNTAGLTFSGTNYVTAPDSEDLEITGDITIAFWVNRSSGTSSARVVGKGTTVATTQNYGVWVGNGSTNVVKFEEKNSSGTNTISLSSSTALSTGTWYHVAATLSGTSATVYINGVSDATGTRSGTPVTSTAALTLGSIAGSSGMAGSIDDVRIYGRALSAAEIAALASGYAPAGGGATHTFGNAFIASGDFTIPSGIVTGSSAVTVGGSWTNYGGAYTGTGTTTLNGSGTSLSIVSGGSHFGNLTVSGTGTWTLGDRLWVDGTYTQTNGTVTTATGAGLIAYDFGKSGGTLSGAGPVVMRSTTAQTVQVNTSSAPLRVESPTETNLYGYWKLDEGRGTSGADFSGNGYTATLNGTAGWSSTVPTTDFDDASSYALTGATTTYASVTSNSNLQITGDITIALWVYRTASTGSTARLVGKGSTSTTQNYAVTMGSGATPTLTFQEYSGGSAILNVTSNSTFALNTWYHVACTLSGTSATIYVNGVSDATGTRSSGTPTTNTNALTFGYAGFNSAFAGYLDEIRIYRTPLSSTQVAALAAGRHSGAGGGQVMTLGGSLTQTGDLTVDNGTLDASTSNYAVAVSGSFVSRGTFTARSGTVTLNGTGTSNSLVTNGAHLNNLTISGTGTWTLGDALNVDGTLTMSAAATLSQSGSNYAINTASANQTAGTISGSGTLLMNASSTGSIALSNAAVSTVQIGAQSNTNMVGYWAVDEASGSTIVDSSGNGNTGTLHGNATWVTSNIPTLQYSNPAAFYLDGSSGTYVSLGVNNLPANNAAQSICLWVKYPSTSGNQNFITLVNSASSSAVQLGLRSGVLLAWMWGGSSLASVTAPSDGGWHHFCYTYDTTTHKVYVDGVAGSSTSTTPQTATPTAAYLGTYDGVNELFTGYLDDIRVYSRTLTAAEVSGLAAGSYYGTQTGATYTATGAISTSGDFTVLGGGLDMSASNYAMTIGGSYYNYGTFTARSGTVTFNGSSTGKTILSSKYHFNNLTVSGSGSWTLGDRLWVDGALTVSNGTLSQSSSSYNIRANTVTQSSGTLSGNGTLALQSRSNNTVTLSNNSIKTVRLESNAETNLVGYWKCDSGIGSSLTDSSGTGNTATMSGNSSWYTATLPSTSFDNYSALNLDGTNSYATVSSPSSMPALTAAKTVSFWAKYASSTATQNIVVMRNGSDGLQLGLSGGNIRIWSFSGGTIMTTTAPSDGAWHHIAYTYSTSGTATHTLYLDGVLKTTSTGATPSGVTSTVYFGTYSPSNELYAGQVDDIRIYSAALTANQISGLAAGRYSGIGGGATFTLGANLNVPGTFALDNGTLATSSYTLNAATSDTTQASYINSGQLTIGSANLTFNGGLTVQLQATATQSSTGRLITTTGKSVGFIETTGTMEGFPTAAFDWSTFTYWREYVAYRSFSSTNDRLIARTPDGVTSYVYDLAFGTYGHLVGTPRWNMEGANHYVYLVTASGYVFKLQDTGSAFSAVGGSFPYRNGASATATSPLNNDNSNLYWCGRDSGGTNKKLFSLTLAGSLNNSMTTANDVTAAPTLGTISGTDYTFIAAQAGVYKANLNGTQAASNTQPTTTVNGRVIAFNSKVYFPEDNGKIWQLAGSNLATNWSYQDTANHGGSCSSGGVCAVKSIYLEPFADDLYFGDGDGHLYRVTGGSIHSGFPWRPGSSSDVFQTAPLYRSGVILMGTTTGTLYEIDQDTGSGPAVTRTYTLNGAVTSISYNSSANNGTGAYTVGTASGAIYYIVAGTDPTPSST